jgi:hypothetical protein
VTRKLAELTDVFGRVQTATVMEAAVADGDEMSRAMVGREGGPLNPRQQRLADDRALLEVFVLAFLFLVLTEQCLRHKETGDGLLAVGQIAVVSVATAKVLQRFMRQ